MASHYKWYPASEEIVVPWNARYAFPSQANKAVKMTPRIPPKSGQTFAPGQIIRIEFPAQGYVNPQNTTLEFDVTMVSPVFADSPTPAYSLRFQNNIQSLFQRVRLLYGATPLEDILNYNVIVRALTEWTATNQINTIDQTSIAEGIGGAMLAFDQNGVQGICNVRQKFIQGLEFGIAGTGTQLTGGSPAGYVPNGLSTLAGVTVPAGAVTSTRRYQVNFALGLFTQDKLIPVKFMASQLAIEITLEQPTACMFLYKYAGTITTAASYYIGNVNLIPEILEFDSSYDAMFLRGLREGGVPIKFSSWHSFFFTSAASSTINLQVQERSRSVKALFAVQRYPQANINVDNGGFLFDSSSNGVSALQSFQFRIGGRYFPASPVQCALTLGSSTTNGGCEAFVELQKALNCVGDYRLSTSVNTNRWAVGTSSAGVMLLSDFGAGIGGYASSGIPVFIFPTSTTNSFVTLTGSLCFAMATDLETSNGMEISGLNAEEQSDIALLAQWYAPQVTGNANTASAIEVYSYYDAMIVLRENNVLELIQ
jgi:hypothetical protein